MKTSRFSDSQIIAILKQAEAGSPVPDCAASTDQLGHVLQMAEQVRRHGCLPDGPAEGARGGEPAAQEDVCRRAAQGRDRSGGSAKKVVKPSCRREMAQRAVEKGVTSGWPARRLASARPVIAIRQSSQQRMSRSPTPDPPDPQPAQLGVRAVLPASAQREGLPMEPQAGVSDLPRTGTEPADQAEEADCSGEAGAAGRAGASTNVVDGFHARSARRWPELSSVQRHRRLQPRRPGHRGRLSLPAERVVRSLDQIIEWRGKPLAIRSDNGPEYISATLITWARSRVSDWTTSSPASRSRTPTSNATTGRSATTG